MRTVHNFAQQKKKRMYLRDNMTRAEDIFWHHVRRSELGYKFRRQHSIKNYIVDFYCPQLKLIIELDGEVHNFRVQSQRDWLREKELEKLGFTVIRYKNEDIILNLADVLSNLKNIFDKLLEEINQSKEKKLTR